ncbi:MAG: ABC transporter permease [Holophagaceae bacterium]|nr:ABC transporter permease [Holophagaceae bacterium]
MTGIWSALRAEIIKMRKSSLVRTIWVLPLIFVIMEFFFFQSKMIGVTKVPEELLKIMDTVQIKMTGALWGGYFYPIFIAILPALIFRIEHRNKMWNHLGAMPTSQARIFCIKALSVTILSLASLAFVWFLLWVEQSLMAFLAPQVHYKFHGYSIAILLGWLWLGSLPVMSIYLWISNRINSIAVPIVFGIVGVLLTTMLTSQVVNEPWKRDFIPWVTPTICVLQILTEADADKGSNLAGNLFMEEPDVIRTPEGKKLKTWQNIPDDELFPPPPPTPNSALAFFSLVFSLLFLLFGAWDSKRCRK